MDPVITRETSVVIIGGGPGGYEAALVAAQLGAAGHRRRARRPRRRGRAHRLRAEQDPDRHRRLHVRLRDRLATSACSFRTTTATRSPTPWPQPHAVNGRILGARRRAERATSRRSLEQVGVTVLRGTGRLAGRERVVGRRSRTARRSELPRRRRPRRHRRRTPRSWPRRAPDGERILTWQQIYALDELPEHLIVVGSGVTGAELAQAYLGLGSQVVLVSSRDRVLPGEDADAATVIEDVFRKRGMEVLEQVAGGLGRAHRRRRRRHASSTAATVEGSHALLAVGSVPNTAGLGLEEAGVELSRLRAHPGRPGLAHLASAASTRPATAPACCPSRPSPPCRDASPCAHALGDAVSPAQPARRRRQHLHRARDRHRRLQPERRRRGRADVDVVMLPLAPQPARQDAGHQRRLRQALRPQGLRHRARRRRRRPARRPS